MGSSSGSCKGCFTQCVGHCIRFVFLFIVLQYFIACFFAIVGRYDNSERRELLVHAGHESTTKNEIDITLCPSPPFNYTGLLEVGTAYRKINQQLEGALFADMATPDDVGTVFKEMNDCLRTSQFMRSTEDLLDRIDMASRMGCISKRAEPLAEARSQTPKDFLKHFVIDHSYDLLANHFERKDGFQFYYTSEIIRGIGHLKWDNLTFLDFIDRITIDLDKIVKIRSVNTSSTWTKEAIHTRYAPSCVKYRLQPASDGREKHKYTFDIDSMLCGRSLANTNQQWRRDYCQKEGLGLMLHATNADGFHALGGLYQRPPIWLPTDKSSVVELVVYRKRTNEKFCEERKDSRVKCLEKCLVYSALFKIDCTLPWLEAKAREVTKMKDGAGLKQCSSYEGAIDTLEITDRLMDHPSQSECWRHCTVGCSTLHVEATLAGTVEQPEADQRITLTLLMESHIQHLMREEMELPSLTQCLAMMAAVTVFFSGVSLLSCSRWLLRLSLFLGGARRYLAALRPICVADLYPGRALRRARVAYRWLWLPRPLRPWLRPADDHPQSGQMCRVLISRAALATQRRYRPDTLAELDTDSESDSATSNDSREAVDCRGRLRQLGARVVKCLKGGCGNAAEEEAMKEIEAELAMEEELELLIRIASSRGIVVPSSLYSTYSSSHHRRRLSSVSHGSHRPSQMSQGSRMPSLIPRGSRRASMMSDSSRRPTLMPDGSRRSSRRPTLMPRGSRVPGSSHHGTGVGSGNLLLAALGGNAIHASRFSVSGKKRPFRSSVLHSSSTQPGSPRSPMHQPGQTPSVPLDGSSKSLRGRRSSYGVPGQHPSQYDRRRSPGRGRRPSAYEEGRGRRPSAHEVGRGRRPSAYEEGHVRRPSAYEEGRRPSAAHRPSVYEDGHGHRPSVYEDGHGHRPSVYEEGRRPSAAHRPSVYEDGRGHRPSVYEDGHGHRPSVYEDGHGHIPSVYEEGRRPSAARGLGPGRGRGRGRGRGGRGRSRGRGRGRGSRPSIAPDEGRGSRPSIAPDEGRGSGPSIAPDEGRGSGPSIAPDEGRGSGPSIAPDEVKSGEEPS